MKNLAILLTNGAEGVPVDEERAEKLLADAQSMDKAPMEDDDDDDEDGMDTAEPGKTEDEVAKKDEPKTE